MIRFAQSTADNIDINDLRVILLNHIVSKQTGEDLLIRIDDIDKENNIEGVDKEIVEILNLFGTDHSKVVYQSENIKYHTQMAMKLLLDKKAFNCFCTKEAVEEDKIKAKQDGKPYEYSGFCQTISDETKFNCNAPFVVRLTKPNHIIKFNDSIKGELSYKSFEVDSVVILNHKKTPTNEFASAVDDMLYNTSTIIQNEDLINSAREIHIRESLGYEKNINYTHIPKVINLTKNTKLTYIKDLIAEGYLPIAISNYLVTLGYDTPKEIFSIEEAIKWFDINKISKLEQEFDINELNRINKEYLNTMDELRLSKIVGFADEDIGKLAKLYLEECSTISEIKDKIQTIFNSKKPLSDSKIKYDLLLSTLQDAPYIDKFDDFKKYIIEKTQISDEELLMPLSYILTGATSGPNLGDIYPLIKNYLGEIIK